MSRTTFTSRFRRAAGQPPLAYLTSRRMRPAERALRETDGDLATIAGEPGFASPSSFSHALQREVGTTPGRFRAAARGPDRP